MDHPSNIHHKYKVHICLVSDYISSYKVVCEPNFK